MLMNSKSDAHTSSSARRRRCVSASLVGAVAFRSLCAIFTGNERTAIHSVTSRRPTRADRLLLLGACVRAARAEVPTAQRKKKRRRKTNADFDSVLVRNDCKIAAQAVRLFRRSQKFIIYSIASCRTVPPAQVCAVHLVVCPRNTPFPQSCQIVNLQLISLSQS